MKKFFICLVVILVIAPLRMSNSSSYEFEITSSIRTTVLYGLNFQAETPNSWKKVSIASRYNNPGNLRSIYSGKFRKFKTLEDGYMALLKDISYKQNGKSRHCDSTTTVRDFIHVYAPPFENNTRLYIKTLCSELGIDDDMPIGQVITSSLARAIISIEDPLLYDELYIPIVYNDTIYKYERF